jgi:hypothetical protein
MLLRKCARGRGIVTFLLFLMIIPCIVSAGQDSQKLVGQKVYVKHNLIFLDDPPKVYPGQIVFVKEINICDEQSMWGFAIGKAAQIEIVKIIKEPKFVRVVLNAEEFGYHDVLLARSKRGSFKKSFYEIFSMKPVEEAPYDREPKTEHELIKWFGYPIYTCHKGRSKIVYYNERFIGRRLGGFHDAWLVIENGKIIDVYGYI